MPRISRGIARNEVIPLSPPGWRDIVIPLPVGVRFLKAWLIFSQAPLNSFGGLWLVEQFPHICIHSWSDLAQICWMNSILDIHASPVYHASRYSCSFGASCLFSRAISMFLQTNCLSNRGKIWWQISLWDSPGLVTFWQRCVEFRHLLACGWLSIFRAYADQLLNELSQHFVGKLMMGLLMPW